MNVIEATGLVKAYANTRALDGANLTVKTGQIHGFLGPNGAGKSTTLRAILGQISLDDGKLQVFGRDPRTDVVEIHQNLAYVPGDVVLWPSMTGGECLDTLAGFHHATNRDRRARLIDDFKLDVRKKARAYSKGNRQKVALIAALALDVELYIFDEPTSGLDPLMEAIFQQHILQRQAEGATVLLSSHLLDEVERVCTDVTILRDGRTVSAGKLAELSPLSDHFFESFEQ